MSALDEKSDKNKFGRIFGGRGRGFIPTPISNEESIKGLSETNKFSHSEKNGSGHHHRSDDYDDWDENCGRNGSHEETKKNDFERHDYGWGDASSERDRDKEDVKGKDDTEKKPRSTYIPDAPTEDDDELFGNNISSGINFNKYDDIEVKVSGENPPEPINDFEESGIKSLIMENIKKCNYTKPTPVQKYSIPTIMSGRDVMGCAQTGSGKTAAFLIPITNKLLDTVKPSSESGSTCAPQAIILSPTRELAIQIFTEARKFSRGSHLTIEILYGGTSVRYQARNVSRGCNILVATPGRLLDFISRKFLILSKIQFLVLDEADRMLDLGFLPSMEKLLADETMVSSSERQTIMFSATFPEEIQRLAGKFLTDYIFIAVGIVGGACSDVEQRFYSLPRHDKRSKIVEILNDVGSEKTVVFVEQKRSTDFLATFLCEKNFPATTIHGDREQKEREEALKDFKSGKKDVLVATSVASRGLDIKNVSHVINFDLPKSIDEYVHRIGRTGRLGNRGLATSFYDPSVDSCLAPDLVRILKQAGQEIPGFLLDHSGEGSNSDSYNKFGGRDYRNRPSNFSGAANAKQSVFEDEVW